MSAIPDVKPAKSGVVRDRELRDQLRAALKGNGLNPDDFSAEQLKVLLNPKDYRLRLRSGVSVKSVSGNKVSNRARSCF